MSDKRGVDISGLLVFVLVLASVATGLFFISRLPDAVVIVLGGSIGVAIAASPFIVGLALISRPRDRPAPRDPDVIDAYPTDQRSYITERRQAAQLAELELREARIEFAKEQSRARLLPSANATPADAYEWPAARQPTAHRVITIGDDDE